LDCYVKAWDEWICTNKRVYELWMMNLDKSRHVISMKWLILKWHGIGMRWNSIFVNWQEGVGMNFTCEMNEDWLQRLAWNLYVWWVSLYCLIMIGLWSVRKSSKSLGEISGSCFNGWDIIPWPLLVEAHGGAHLYNLVRIQGKVASWRSKESVSLT